MEFQYTPKKYICSEPPVLQKIREVFSSSILILAAILGGAAAIILPAFFVFKLPGGDILKFSKTLLITDFAVLLPNVLLFLSLLIMSIRFKSTAKEIKPSAFSAFSLFLTLTPLTTLCLFYETTDVFSNITRLSLLNLSAAIITALMMAVHIFAACSLKTAVKSNLPRRAFVLLSAIVFVLCETSNCVYFFKNTFLENGIALVRFKYAGCIGSALFITLTLTATAIIAIKLISYHINIGKVKNAFKVKESI